MPIPSFVSAAWNCAAPIRLQYSVYITNRPRILVLVHPPFPTLRVQLSHSTVQITRWPSTVHGRKCSLVTRKELGYSPLKPGSWIDYDIHWWERSIHGSLSQLGSEKSLCYGRMLANSLWFYCWARTIIVPNSLSIHYTWPWHPCNTKSFELSWHKNYYWRATQLSAHTICWAAAPN